VSNRDRLLAAMFALQLLVAAVLGGYLVHALRDTSTTTTLSQTPAGGPVDSGPVPSGTASPAAGTPVTGPKTTTTTTGGKAGGGAVTGPASADTKVIAAGAPIKVGAIVTQTGAINFASSAQATKAYFDMVNRAGGVNGHKIVLDMRDDQLDPARGRQQAQQLVASGVFAFTGWNAPLTENGITPFLKQNKIPLIGGYGEQEEYHSPYAYAFSATYGHFGYQMGTYLAEQGVKKPGLVFITNNSTKADNGLKDAFKAGFKAKGVTLSDSEIVSVDPTKPSYDDVVTQFKLDGVDGMATLLDQTAYNRLNQAQDRQAFHPKHAASPLFVDPTVRQSSSTDGTFVAADYDFVEGGGPAVQEYASTVRQAFGSRAQINYFGEQGWVDAKVFVAAIKQLGNTITRDALLKTMDKLDGRGGFGFTSDLKFGPGVRDLNRCVKFGKMVSGKVTRVTDWRCDAQPF
jgi:ABC-type branched-subunit amino acid transport system substrate-binding protein